MQLKHNSVVLTGFQFVEQNPLGFFQFDNLKEIDDVFKKKTNGFEASGKLVVKNNGFAPQKDEKGQNKAKKDVFVVTRAKSRPVLVFQNIDFSKQYHDNVFVIPIQTLKKPEKSSFEHEKDYLKKLKEYNDIKNKSKDFYDTYYAPITLANGDIWERILVLSDSRFVHMSTLYGTVIENQLSTKDIEEISIRLSKMINIEKLEKCNDCVYNYENYIQKLKEVSEEDIKKDA